MNISSKHDRHWGYKDVRKRIRDFLLVRGRFESDGSVLRRLQDLQDVPGAKVKAEIVKLIESKWRHDDVYVVTTDDLVEFVAHVEAEIRMEKAMAHLEKAASLARAAGFDHFEMQNRLVEVYDRLEAEETRAADAAAISASAPLHHEEEAPGP